MGQLRDKRMRWVGNRAIVWQSCWMWDGWQVWARLMTGSFEFSIAFLTFREEVLCLAVAWHAWDENSQQSAVVSAVMTEINTIITNNLQVSGSMQQQSLSVCWQLFSSDSSIPIRCLISQQVRRTSCNGFVVLFLQKYLFQPLCTVAWRKYESLGKPGIHWKIILKHELILYSADSWQICPPLKWLIFCSSSHENSKTTHNQQGNLLSLCYYHIRLSVGPSNV